MGSYRLNQPLHLHLLAGILRSFTSSTSAWTELLRACMIGLQKWNGLIIE
jgi:hypothetical protein